MFKLEGYALVYLNRKTRGGGVGFYVKMCWIGLIGYFSYGLYLDKENNPVLTSIKTTTKNIEALDFPTG